MSQDLNCPVCGYPIQNGNIFCPKCRTPYVRSSPVQSFFAEEEEEKTRSVTAVTDIGDTAQGPTYAGMEEELYPDQEIPVSSDETDFFASMDDSIFSDFTGTTDLPPKETAFDQTAAPETEPISARNINIQSAVYEGGRRIVAEAVDVTDEEEAERPQPRITFRKRSSEERPRLEERSGTAAAASWLNEGEDEDEDDDDGSPLLTPKVMRIILIVLSVLVIVAIAILLKLIFTRPGGKTEKEPKEPTSQSETGVNESAETPITDGSGTQPTTEDSGGEDPAGEDGGTAEVTAPEEDVLPYDVFGTVDGSAIDWNTNGTYYCNANPYLNVRSSPTTNADNLIGAYNLGSEIRILGSYNGWGAVLYNGNEGWVYLQYVVDTADQVEN